MSETITGYRAFPPMIESPSKAQIIGKFSFKFTKKTKMQEVPSLCEGHEGTTVWYAGKKGYIVEVRFSSHPTVYAQSICTFTPTMGMDNIDGSFAEDIEAYFLKQKLGYEAERLAIFSGKESVDINDYLRARGFTK